MGMMFVPLGKFHLARNTCPRCTDAHGTIVQAESPDYYVLLPPAQCFGGDRCLGVMVFADGIRMVMGI